MDPSVRHNVVTRFLDAVERVPDRAALAIDRGGGRVEQATFAELWDRGDRISTGLVRSGLAPGDRAILMIPVSVDLYATLLGVLKMGAVVVFVSPWLGREHIASTADHVSPVAYIGSPKSQLLRFKHPRLRRIPLSITTGRRLWRLPARLSLAEIESAVGDGRIAPVAERDPALISFTSGSSGVPKAANRTHDILAGQQLALSATFPVRDDDVDAQMFPVIVLSNLASGIMSVVPAIDFRGEARLDAAAAVALMDRHGATTCAGSPPMIDEILSHIETHPECRPTLRRVLSGGAPVFDAQLARWQRAVPAAEIVVAYGSTEAEPVAHVDTSRLEFVSEVRRWSPGLCAGRPIEQIRTRLIRVHDGPVALVDGDWSPWDVPQGEIGELLVTGDHVCRDYYRNPTATAETKITEIDGTVWHRMGDTGYFDGVGRFWLVGRVHSTIHRDGEAVHPQLIEQAALADDPDVRRAAAVGLPDETLGERVALVLEADDSPELRARVGRRLAEAGQTVDEIIIADEPLPLDPRHRAKIDYPELRRRLEELRAGSRGGT